MRRPPAVASSGEVAAVPAAATTKVLDAFIAAAASASADAAAADATCRGQIVRVEVANLIGEGKESKRIMAAGKLAATVEDMTSS